MVSSNSLNGFFRRFFLNEKLDNWVGFLLVAVISIFFAVLLSNNFLVGIGILVGFAGVCALTVCVLTPLAGLYITTIYCFSASALSRFFFNDQVPIGVVIDILVGTTFLGLFFSKLNLKKNAAVFFKIKPIILYTVIIAYLCFELVNPIGHSFQGWLQVMRKVLESFLIVFIAYNVFDSVSKIRIFINVVFCFVLIIAVYGCFQQWHGLSQAEINWVSSDLVRFKLICLWGVYRKFSLLGGPTEFGIMMGGCSLFYLLIGLHEKRNFKKIIYIAGAAVMILGMSYSGTRTANAMFIAGVALFLLLTINKTSSKLLAFFAVLSFLFMLYAPIYGSATLNRFRSTFSGSKDASYNVRETNRKMVQPFIWSHPFGTGLSTTGEMGKKYNPDNPNAGFPTDSSYLNKALESGWIGMILTCILYFFVLQYAIRGYFLAAEKELKTILAACSAFFFSYYLGEIAQEAVGQFSNLVIYFPFFAIVLRVREFSEKRLVEANTANVV